jgi:hypothetical protein
VPNQDNIVLVFAASGNLEEPLLDERFARVTHRPRSQSGMTAATLPQKLSAASLRSSQGSAP